MAKRILLLLTFCLFLTVYLSAQAPPPPPPNNASTGNGPVGGGAPIGNGILILMVLSASYTAFKCLTAERTQENFSESPI